MSAQVRFFPMRAGRLLRVSCAAVIFVTPLLIAGCRASRAEGDKTADVVAGVTDIAVTNTVLQTGIKRLGINIGGQDFYDSGQMLRNLVSINPGFEGETWESILRC